MSKIRVEEISARASRDVDQGTARLQRRKDLHGSSSYQRSGPPTFSGIGRPDLSALKPSAAPAAEPVESAPVVYRLPDGRELELPRLSADERARVEGILARLTPENRGRLVGSAMALGASVWNEVVSPPAGLKVGAASAGLNDAAGQSFELYVATTGENQQSAVTEGVLVTGIAGVEGNLYDFFGKLQDKQTLSNELRTDVSELESMLADWPPGTDKQLFSYREVIVNPDGTTKVIEHKNEPLTKEQAQALLTKLKGQQDSLTTITTMDSNKLQLMVEKYQQAMNTLSNIIKAQDDTRKAIIANAKAS